MRIKWIDTEEGIQIPVVMVAEGYTIYDFMSIASTGFTFYRGENTREGYVKAAHQDEAMEIFDATHDELSSMFSQNLSISYILYNAPRKELTIPQGVFNLASNENKNRIRLRIDPSALINSPPIEEHYTSFGNHTLYNDTVTNRYPFNINILPSSYTNVGMTMTQELDDDDSREIWVYVKQGRDDPLGRNSGETGIYRDLPVEWGLAQIPALVTDDSGTIAYSTFEMLGSESRRGYEDSDYEGVLRGKVNVRSGGSTGASWVHLDFPWWSGVDDVQGCVPGEDDDIVDLTGRYSPRVGSNMLGLYILNQSDLFTFADEVWTTGFVDKFLNMMDGKPLDSVVSLRWYYGLKDHIQYTEDDAYLTMGNVVFDGTFSNRAFLPVPVAKSEYMMYDFGEIDVRRHFGNFLDFQPFTEMEVFLPYYGNYKLTPTEYVGKSMRIIYNINLLTGVANIHIYNRSSENDCWDVADTVQTIIGMEIPFDIDGRESITSRAISSAVGTMGAAAVPILAGGPTLAAPAAAGVVGGLSNAISSSDNNPSGSFSGGGMSDESGSLGRLNCKLSVSRPEPVVPAGYDMMVGSPSFNTLYVKDIEGYFKVGAIENSDVSIPNEAFEEVEQLLREGVYSE